MGSLQVIGRTLLKQVSFCLCGGSGHRMPACPSPFMTQIVPPRRTQPRRRGNKVRVHSLPSYDNKRYIVCLHVQLPNITPSVLCLHLRHLRISSGIKQSPDSTRKFGIAVVASCSFTSCALAQPLTADGHDTCMCGVLFTTAPKPFFFFFKTKSYFSVRSGILNLLKLLFINVTSGGLLCGIF